MDMVELRSASLEIRERKKRRRRRRNAGKIWVRRHVCRAA